MKLRVIKKKERRRRRVIVVVQLTVLLAAGDLAGPVAVVRFFVVEQTAGAELLGGGAVPAGPVADAGLFVAEDSVLPVAHSRADGRVCASKTVSSISSSVASLSNQSVGSALVRLTGQLLVLADVAEGGHPRVVAELQQLRLAAGEDETVGAVEVLGFALDALPVAIAVVDVGHQFALGSARVRLRLLSHACRSIGTHTHTHKHTHTRNQ